jgi:hypothetical protein
VLCLWFLLVNIMMVGILEKRNGYTFLCVIYVWVYWINRKRGMLGRLDFLALVLYVNLCF